MTDTDAPKSPFFGVFRECFQFFLRPVPQQPPAEDSPDYSKHEQESALEMMTRNPNAIRGALDLETMTRLYRCR